MIPTCSQDVRETREAELEEQERERQLELKHARECCDGWVLDDAGSAVPCIRCRPREYAAHWAQSRAEAAKR
ncbi:MAG: hypothetical protein NVSMB48_05610 [Marmoricola sp.]